MSVVMWAVFKEIKTPGHTDESYVVSEITSDTPDSPEEVPGTRNWIEALVHRECSRRNEAVRTSMKKEWEEEQLAESEASSKSQGPQFRASPLSLASREPKGEIKMSNSEISAALTRLIILMIEYTTDEGWLKWATAWLDGSDRSAASARRQARELWWKRAAAAKSAVYDALWVATALDEGDVELATKRMAIVTDRIGDV